MSLVDISVRNPYEIRILDCNPSRDWINPIPFQILGHHLLEIHIPHSHCNRNPSYSNSQSYSHELCTCIPKSLRYGIHSPRMYHKILKILHPWLIRLCTSFVLNLAIFMIVLLKELDPKSSILNIFKKIAIFITVQTVPASSSCDFSVHFFIL